MTLRAGAASADITPAVGGMLDGYGGRLTGSQGVHDPLMARAVVFDYGSDGAVAVVVCDLLGMHPWMAAEVRRRASALGIAEDALVLAATHDHAAPAGLRAGMFATLDTALAEDVVTKVVGAIEAAWAARREVTIAVGDVQVPAVAMNRRDPDGPADATLRVVLLDSDEGPVACLLNYACHATVLKGDNLLLTAEFPGVACRIVEQATGAGAVYVQGACGDVNPVWTRQDFASVERAGQAVGGAAVALIAALRGRRTGLRAHNIRWDEFTETDVAGRMVEPRLRFARREIDLPLREFEADEIYAARVASAQSEAERLGEALAHEEALGANRAEALSVRLAKRMAVAEVQRWSNERWAAAWSRRSGEKGTRRTEVQALQLGEGLSLIALPGEFFSRTGEMIREESGIEDLMIGCYANDYIGYIVPADEYELGGYESGVTFFAREAEAIIRRTSVEMLNGLNHGK